MAMPREQHGATRAKIDLRLVAEPAGQMPRLGDDRPDHVRGCVDFGLPGDRVGHHRRDIITDVQPQVALLPAICNHELRFPHYRQEMDMATAASRPFIAAMQVTLDGYSLGADGTADWVDSWAD